MMKIYLLKEVYWCMGDEIVIIGRNVYPSSRLCCKLGMNPEGFGIPNGSHVTWLHRTWMNIKLVKREKSSVNQ